MKNIENGERNVAIGYQTMYNSTDALDNVAIGYGAMLDNQTGGRNVAIGTNALQHSINGFNTAIGYNSLANINNIGNENTAIGNQTLTFNTSGYGNTAVGNQAMFINETGYQNTAIGSNSGPAFSGMTQTIAIGAGTKVYSDYSIVLGNTDFDMKVGIGDSSPESKLDIEGTYNTEPLVKLTQFGTLAPALKIAASSGHGLELENAPIRITGTNKFVFQHVCTAGNQSGANATIIPNTTFANSATDLLIITPVFVTGGVFANFTPHAFWDAGTSNWMILNPNGTSVPVNTKFNVMVIKQ
jgi:hypothetical protein